jgi:hypothetical protein
VTLFWQNSNPPPPPPVLQGNPPPPPPPVQGNPLPPPPAQGNHAAVIIEDLNDGKKDEEEITLQVLNRKVEYYEKFILTIHSVLVNRKQ